MLDDAEPFDGVRREFAVSTVGRGIPFHVTLLWPFVSRKELTDAVIADTRSLFAAQRPFEFALTRLATWPAVVYAVPEPDAKLRECMEALHARFPDWPPYGGIHADVVPHETLGEDVNAVRAFPEIQRRLEGHLPLHCRADAATLLEEFAPDQWRERERLLFGR